MQPVQTLLRSAARWLLVVLPLGVLLRSAFVWIYTPGPFSWGDLIHAHSHTAYFGWAELGLMGLMLYVLPRLTGRPLAMSGALRWLLGLAPLAVGGVLVTFALWGYSAPSIAFSTLNEVLWGLFAAVFWQQVKGRRVAEWPAALWLMGSAVLLLLISGLGTVLVILFRVVMPTFDPVLSNAGIYLFLQAFGDGWLEVGLLGVVAALMDASVGRGLAKWACLAFLVLNVPATLRLLVPFGVAGPLAVVGGVAGLGLGVAQLVLLWSLRPEWGRIPAASRPWWALAAGAIALKALMEVAPLLPIYPDLAGERHLVIAFLHLKLLMGVSAGLIGALAWVRPGAGGRWAFGLFATGTVVMVGSLGAHGLWAGDNPVLGRWLFGVAFAAAVAAALGGMGAVWRVASSRSSDRLPSAAPAVRPQSPAQNRGSAGHQ